LPALPSTDQAPLSRDIIRQIAMDVGKQVAHHIETMYPAAVEAASSTFLMSVRNTVHNEIMAAVEHTTEEAILARIERNRQHRRKINRFRKLGDKTET
jgi:hypothetical protein